jgi:hypothetical protein
MQLTGERQSTCQKIGSIDSVSTRTPTWTGLGLDPGAPQCEAGG